MTISSWFLPFTFGQSQYDNRSSCIILFIINDLILGKTKSFQLIFTETNKINYIASKVAVNITKFEDPNHGMALDYVMISI